VIAAVDEISEVLSCPPVCLPPWVENPHRLVSWLDMLIFSAKAFFRCGCTLEDIRADCLVAAAIVVNDEVGFAVTQDLDEKARNKVIESTAFIEKEFRNIGLSITAETIKELEYELSSGSRKSFQWLLDQIRSIERLAEKELKDKLFLYVPPDRARFWPKNNEPYAFGKTVSDSFPSSTFDANSAGICLATAQSTAAVFHLMRVLEIGLRAFAGRFGIPSDRKNWQNIIEEIEKAIRKMTDDPNRQADWKDQQEFYSGAATQFMFFKDAWRNYVAHGRDKCTQDEAERVFTSVRAFMQMLAARLQE
jgi:hypothetical protein